MKIRSQVAQVGLKHMAEDDVELNSPVVTFWVLGSQAYTTMLR